MANYTSDKLLATIKRGAGFPKDGAVFTDSDILSFCDEQINSYVTQKIINNREENFVYKMDIPLVANKAKYRIPSRAIGAGLRFIQYTDNNGTVTMLRPYNPAQPETFPTSYALPVGYYLESNSIVLLPKPTAALGNLTLGIYLRPGKLVVPAQVGVINDLDVENSTITFTGPASFTGSLKYDLVKGSSGFETLKVSFTPTQLEDLGPGEFRATVDFDVSEVDVGDYFCLAEESPVPQLPIELHSWLAQKVKCQILEATGDSKNFQLAQSQLMVLETMANDLMAPRDDGAVKKIVSIWKRTV